MDPSQLQAYLMQLNSQTPPGALGDAFLGGTVANPMSPTAADNTAAATAALETGQVIDLGGLTYKFTQGLNLTLTGMGGFVNGTLDFSAAVSAPNCMFLSGPGLQGTAVNFTADGHWGDHTITVADGSQFVSAAPYTEIIIQSNKVWAPTQPGYTFSERNWIISATGNVITLLIGLVCDYAVADVARVQIVSVAYTPYFNNIRLICPGLNSTVADQSQAGFCLNYTTRAFLDNIAVSNVQHIGVFLDNCSLTHIGKIDVQGVLNTGGLGYGYVVSAGRGNYCGSVIARRCRHGVAISGATPYISRNTIVDNVQVYGSWEQIINVHPSAADVTFGNAEGHNREDVDVLNPPTTSAGQAAGFNGFRCSVNTFKVDQVSHGGIMALQDEGQQDTGRINRYYVGRVEATCVNQDSGQVGLLVEGLSQNSAIPGFDVYIGSMEIEVGRGFEIEADQGNIGTVYVGPSRIISTTTAPVDITWSNGYKIDRVIMDHPRVTASAAQTAHFLIGGSGVTQDPVIELINPVASGAVTNSVQVTNGVVTMTHATLAGYTGNRSSLATGSILIEDGWLDASISLTATTLTLPTISAGQTASYETPRYYRCRVSNGGSASFDTISGGALKNQVVYFSGSGITIKHNVGNILNTTGADVVMSSSYIYGFMFDGTDWWGIV